MIIELQVAKNVFIYEKKMKFKEFIIYLYQNNLKWNDHCN